MSDQKAARYDQLVRDHTAIQNAMSRVPQLSIEEQSKLVDVNERYNPENQKRLNQLQSQLFQIEQQLKNLF